jgi:F-type H+-transporting ATPase subunit delta
MRDRTTLYADALYTLIVAEGSANEVRDELSVVTQAITANEELRGALLDPHIPAGRRQQIVEDLLEGNAHAVTVAVVSFIVATGRIRDLADIVEGIIQHTAAANQRLVAEVRSAVPLDDDQKTRLAESIRKSTGQDVDVLVIVDPSVLGGIVTQIGDEVIDGSVRHRLAQLKEAF